MKLASLKSTSRDGSLIAVSRDLKRYSDISDIAPTMQYALENWPQLERALVDAYEGLECGNERPEFDFQAALSEGKIAAPLPRTHQWLDGSAYLTRGARATRAQR
jgi:fumarylacetoacetate (FAA) hydrolase